MYEVHTMANKKMSYVVAVENAINGELTPEVIEHLEALKASLAKRNARKGNGGSTAHYEMVLPAIGIRRIDKIRCRHQLADLVHRGLLLVFQQIQFSHKALRQIGDGKYRSLRYTGLCREYFIVHLIGAQFYTEHGIPALV